jgi:hypothetical protein
MAARLKTLLVILMLPLCACQSLSEKRQADALEETLRDYETLFRWGDLAQLHRFSGPRLRGRQLVVAPDLRITRYEVVQGPTVVTPDQALQSVVIEYVLESTQQVKELLDEQIWRYDADNEAWFRQNPLAEFR